VIQERIGRVDGLGIDGYDHWLVVFVMEGRYRDIDASAAVNSDSNS
jgi:hypothetical protein